MNAQSRKKTTKAVETLGKEGPITEMMLIRAWMSGKVKGAGEPRATMNAQIDMSVKKKIEAAAKYQGCSQSQIIGYLLRQSGPRLHYLAGGAVVEGDDA
jgi:hypothetical protein